MSENVSELSSASSLWNTIREVAEGVGVDLFDIDYPAASGRGGVLRVYLARAKGSAPAVEGGETEPRTGVSFEDCVKVSKILLDLDEQSGLIPEGCVLEVSSPGINRRLRLPQHFLGAVGERVRVKFRTDGGSYRVLTGALIAADGDRLMVEDEQGREQVEVGLSLIKEARVDFKF
jgi:ribosome maturation factor RimP